jgi:hypothetical protein
VYAEESRHLRKSLNRPNARPKCQIDKESSTMLDRDLSNILIAMDPDSQVFVVLYTSDGRRETFDIIDVTASNDSTYIEISEGND